MGNVTESPRKRVVETPTPKPPRPTRAQMVVLGAIAKQPKGMRVTIKLIANELGISESNAHKRLWRMERDGLVRRGGWEVVS